MIPTATRQPLTPDLFEMVATGVITEEEAYCMMGSSRTADNKVPNQPLVPIPTPPPLPATANQKPKPPLLPPLTPDLFEMVANGVMSEEEARRMMGSSRTTDFPIATNSTFPSHLPGQPMMSYPTPSPPPPPPTPTLPTATATATATTLPAAAEATDQKPNPPPPLPPLTPDLFEMVANGVMSEEEARHMMGSPGTVAGVISRLAEADEKVISHASIHMNSYRSSKLTCPSQSACKATSPGDVDRLFLYIGAAAMGRRED